MQAFEQALSRYEGQLLSRNEELQAAVAKCEELQTTITEYKQTQPRIDKLEETVVVESRNLVVCIDGTANQFGVKVGLILFNFSRNPFLIPSTTLLLETEFERRRALPSPYQGSDANHILQQRYWNVCATVVAIVGIP